MEQLTRKVVAEVVGSTAQLLFTALNGPAALQARSARMDVELEQQIEQQIEQHSAALEACADEFCMQVEALDALERKIGRFDIFEPD